LTERRLRDLGVALGRDYALGRPALLNEALIKAS
jgi:hypothetical protein